MQPTLNPTPLLCGGYLPNTIGQFYGQQGMWGYMDGGSLLALSVQHVLECIVMASIQRTKLSDSFTTFDTIKPIYFTAALICSDALPILGVISAVTFIIRVQNK